VAIMMDNNGRPLVHCSKGHNKIVAGCSCDDGTVDALMAFVGRGQAAQAGVDAEIIAHGQRERLRREIQMAFAVGWYRWWLSMPLLAVLLFVGCGNVSAVDDADAGPPAVEAAPDAGPADGGAAPTDTKPATDVQRQCVAADGCAACVQAGPAGPGYRFADQCRQVITCATSGDGGAYPWQSCHNAAGGGDEYGGLACAQALVARCPQ